jgi:hypothetical protein
MAAEGFMIFKALHWFHALWLIPILILSLQSTIQDGEKLSVLVEKNGSIVGHGLLTVNG